MHRFHGTSAGGHARQHNGDVHGNIIYNLTSKQRHDGSDTETDKALIPSTATISIRPLDARFDGDEQAITVWLKKNNLRISKTHSAVDNASLIDRMSSYSVYRTYQRLVGRRLAGTTQWISRTPDFENWLVSTSSTELFIIGKVGSGKTTLITTMIQHALEAAYPKSPVLSFFFEEPSRSAVDLFASLTQQLLRHMIATGRSLSKELRLAVQQLYNQELARPTLKEIQEELFEPVLEYFPGCVIVVDGIDNAENSLGYSTIQYFRKLLKRTFARILMSARDDLDLPVHVSRIDLTSSLDGSLLNDIDIKRYVDAKLDGLALPGKLLANDSLRSLVKDELLRNAQGMFLWVVLQIENLFGRDGNDDGQCRTAADVRRNIKQMPQGLEGIYTQCLLRRQSGSQARYTARILRWVCASPEPVHVDNMRELLAFDPQSKCLLEDEIPSRDSTLRDATNLVVLESSDHASSPQVSQTHYFLPIHSTVRDFVFSAAGQLAISEIGGPTKHWTRPGTVLEMGGICAAYLIAFSGRELVAGRKTIASSVPSTPMLQRVYDTSLSSRMARITKNATGWWFSGPEAHTTPLSRLEKPSTEVEIRLLDFARRNWHQCLKYAKEGGDYSEYKKLVFDHADSAHRPWTQGRKMSRRSQAQSLFFWALTNDHAPLLGLAMREVGHEKLFHFDFWTEAQAACAGVPILHFAVRRCSEATIALLLPICSGSGSYTRCTALHCAVESASVAVMSLLLNYVEGARRPYQNLLAKDINGRTALHLAFIRNDLGVCQMLCDLCKSLLTTRSDDEHFLDHAGCSPFFYALLTENLATIDFIMDSTILVYHDMSKGGTLAKVQEVVSRDVITHVLERLAKDHRKHTIPTADLERLAASLELPGNFMVEIMANRIESGNSDRLTFDEVCSWRANLRKDVSRAGTSTKQSWLFLLHDVLLSRGMDPKVCLRSSQDLNLADWAVLQEDHTMLSLLAFADSSYFLTAVGNQDGPLSPHRTTRGTPIQLAAEHGLLKVVQTCSPHSSMEAHWQAMLAAAIKSKEVIFEWLRPVWAEKRLALALDHEWDMASSSVGKSPRWITTLKVKASHGTGCLIIPFSEDGSIVKPAREENFLGPAQFVAVPSDEEVLVTIDPVRTSIRLCLLQWKPDRSLPGSIRITCGGLISRYYELDQHWRPLEAEAVMTKSDEKMELISEASLDPSRVVDCALRYWMLEFDEHVHVKWI